MEVANIKVENLPAVIHRIPDPAPVKILLGMNFKETVKLIVNEKMGHLISKTLNLNYSTKRG